jgi:ribosome-associated protein
VAELGQDQPDGLRWVREAARAADSRTDGPTVILDVGEVLAITGWFMITSGTNTRQVRAIAEEIEERVAGAGGPKPLRIEGLDSSQWILMDYGDFIIHVFLEETRAFYDLERLWRDVPTLEWS